MGDQCAAACRAPSWTLELLQGQEGFSLLRGRTCHIAICKALRAKDAKDAEAAAAAMRDHLIATRDRKLKAMEDRP
ncbi:hypothetical protein GCM10022293_49950 [Azospirillum formosense]